MNPETTLMQIPFWEKYALTQQEACLYFHIGERKMRELIEDNRDSDFILMSDRRTMIKRKRFEQFLDRQVAI